MDAAPGIVALSALRALALAAILIALLRRGRGRADGRWAAAAAGAWLLAELLLLLPGGSAGRGLAAALARTVGVFALAAFLLHRMRVGAARTREQAAWVGTIERVLNEIAEPVILYDAQGGAAWANPAAEAWLGAIPQGAPIEELARHALSAAEEEAWLEALASARREGRRQVLPRTLLRQPDGVVRPVELVVFPVGGYLVVLMRDVSWWMAREQRFQALVDEDPLTGLLNRRGLMRAARREVARAQRHHRPLGLLLIDLDHFKEVNDRFGHGVGDEVLREFAQRLRQAARASDLLARYGGEEFAVLLPETEPAQAERAVERLLEEVRARPFATGAGELHVTASAGLAVFPEDGGDWESLFRAADRALYLAKRAGRDTWRPAGAREAS